jgi:hypothetical protein
VKTRRAAFETDCRELDEEELDLGSDPGEISEPTSVTSTTLPSVSFSNMEVARSRSSASSPKRLKHSGWLLSRLW